MNSAATAPIRFGECEVIPARRQVLLHGQPLKLPGRAFDLLLTLLQANGRVISKDELIHTVWPGRIVEENTLEAQVSMLRKALGKEREAIRTVSGRGYQFIAQPQLTEYRNTLLIPARVSELIGRDNALSELAECLCQQRMLTLVGPGGIGKTRLALECARQMAQHFPDRVCMADLAPLSTDEFLVTTIATALGLAPPDGKASLEQIACRMLERRILLILDNCEHLIDTAAHVAETLLQSTENLQILATSREALRVAGEYVYRVAPLDVPEPTNSLLEMTSSSAMRLFDARLEHGHIDPLDQQQSVHLKARICRRLDGIPLAIELAAARVATLGLATVAVLLEDQLDVLSGGNRCALPRQQTLRATLDWSVELLSQKDQLMLRRLSVFAGPFGLDAALNIGVGAELNAQAVTDSIQSLVARSLLNLHQDGSRPLYRLLEVTRSYAAEKLKAAGELSTYRRLHALYLLATFSRAGLYWDQADSVVCGYCDELQEDLREALRWTLDSGNDTRLGIDLTIAALPFWQRRSQISECLLRSNRALRQLASSELFERKVMKLEAARGRALLYTGANMEMREALGTVLQIAERLADYDHQSMAMWGLWAHSYLNGPHLAGLQQAQNFLQLSAQQHPDDELVARRMIALTQLCLGELDAARNNLTDVLTRYPQQLQRQHTLRYAYDQKVAALCALAYILWLQGFADQASNTVREAEQQAEACGHLASQWHVLTMSTCPIALLTGGVAALAAPSQRLLDARGWHHPGTQTIGAGQFWGGEFWRGLYLLWNGNDAAYDEVIQPALEQLGTVRFASFLTPYTSALCTLLASRGRLSEALKLIDMSIAHACSSDDRVSLPELMRCQGELLLLSDSDGWSGTGEKLLIKAQMLAREHHLKAWELRATTSLARLWISQGKQTLAERALTELMESFTEGFASVDFESARQVLTTLELNGSSTHSLDRNPPL